MKLTKNFSKHEYDCKCGCEMPEDVFKNIKKLAEQHQVIRDYIKKPIKITSGYRCESHNRDIGGVLGSKHTKGLAGDLQVNETTPIEMYFIIKYLIKRGDIVEGGLGVYNTFVHYDIRGKKARWNNIK